MPRRRALSLALIAAVSFGSGLCLVYAGRYRHCSTEDVQFRTSDGVDIHAVLYLPKDLSGLTVTADRRKPGGAFALLSALLDPGPSAALAETQPAVASASRRRIPRGTGLPAVVFTHGLFASHEHYETAYSLEISKRGIAVLAIDYRGHGDSGGAMGRLSLAGIEHNTLRSMGHPDLVAAYEYLLGRPEIDPSRIAFAGHSMGGFASTDTAIFLQDRIAATVAIGAAPLYVNVDYPLDFYLLNGARDEFFSPPLGREVIARATDDAVRWEGVQYGRFEDGSARRLDLIPWVNHITEAFSPRASVLTIRWLESALFGAPRGEIHSEVSRRMAGVGLVLLGILAGFGPVLWWTEKRSLGPAPDFLATGVSRRMARRWASALILVYLTSWIAAPGTGLLLLVTRPLRSLPIFLAGPILALLYGGALNLALMGLLLRLLAGRQMAVGSWNSFPGPTPPGRTGEPASAGRPGLPGRVAFGLVPFLYLFTFVNLGLDRHFMDYWPTAREWGQMLMLVPALAPPLLVNEWWLRRWILPLARSRSAGVIVPLGTISCFYLSLKLLIPLHLGFLTIAMSIFMAIMVLPIAYARPSFRRREIVGPWLFHVFTAAWLLAIHLPPR